MAKISKGYVCQACGAVTARWSGKCASCGEWNSIIEEQTPSGSPALIAIKGGKGRLATFETLAAATIDSPRLPTGMAELDRVLGGGLVAGSAVLVGGDPGIGKSTLLLQAAAKLAETGARVVYLSGEEAPAQVRMRAMRLGLAHAPVALGTETNLANIVATLGSTVPPVLVIIDSVQTLWSESVEAAPDRIEMAEKPAEAVRAKPDSSLVAAVRAVADGNADAVVSAGNTGAMLAAGLLHLRRLPGVFRPAIAVPIPLRDGVSVLIDAGANADSRPEHLVQFASMGSIFAEEILGRPDPTVRLLSIGEEPEKGDQMTIEAHELLRESPSVNFQGNAEGRDLLRGAADVVVTDGFTGNLALKLLEGTIRELLEALRAEISATTTGKLGGLLIRPAARRLRTRLDPDTYGGAYLLGLKGLAVIAHGNSGRHAVANAIRLAARGVDHRVVEHLAERLPVYDRRASEPAPTQ